MRRSLLLALVALPVAAAGAVFQPEHKADPAGDVGEVLGPDFARSESEHFIVISDCRSGWTREHTRLMERTCDQFFRVMRRLGADVTEPKEKIVAVFLHDHSRFAAFAMASDQMATDWAGGYYSAAHNRIVIFDDVTSPSVIESHAKINEYAQLAQDRRGEAETAEKARAAALIESAQKIEAWVEEQRESLDQTARMAGHAKAVHETVHALAFNSGFQSRERAYPFWFTEGLATSFETENTGRAFGPDHENPWRQEQLERVVAERRLIPLDDLVGMMEVREAGDAEAMYAQSHALFAYLFRFKRGELRRFSEMLLEEPVESATPSRFKTMFRECFGDPVQIQRRMLR